MNANKTFKPHKFIQYFFPGFAQPDWLRKIVI